MKSHLGSFSLVVVAVGVFLAGCDSAYMDNAKTESGNTSSTSGGTGEDHGPVVTLTADNFEEVVLKSDKPVLVDFWATWCGPCVAMTPTITEIAKEYEGELVVAKLNVDDVSELASKYEASSIPLFVVFRNGEAAERAVGSQPKEKLLETLKLTK